MRGGVDGLLGSRGMKRLFEHLVSPFCLPCALVLYYVGVTCVADDEKVEELQLPAFLTEVCNIEGQWREEITGTRLWTLYTPYRHTRCQANTTKHSPIGGM